MRNFAKEPPLEGTDCIDRTKSEKGVSQTFCITKPVKGLQGCSSLKGEHYSDIYHMVEHLQARYHPTGNHLSIYEFHKLSQNKDKSFDILVNRVKHKTKNCQISCINNNCTVPQTMIRDQIVIGTINKDISQNALKSQWDLEALSCSQCKKNSGR